MIKKQIIRNFISAWLAKLIKLFSAIYMVPVFIYYMGKDVYGLIILLTTILSFSAIADIGIRASTTRYMARAIALQDKEGFNKVLNTGLGIYFFIWLILSIALFFSTELIVTLFNVPSHYFEDCILLLRTYGILSLFCSFVTPLFGAVSSASNRFDLTNYRDSIIGGATIIVLIIAVKFFDISIVGWAVIAVCSQLCTAIAVILIAFKLTPYLRVGVIYFDKTIIKEILKFGGITFVNGWSSKMKVDSDPLLISSLLGPAPIALYRSGVAIPSQASTLLSAFTGQINAVSTNFYALGDKERLTQLFERGTRLTLFMCVPLLIILCVFSYDIVELWLGKTFSESELLISSRCLQGMAILDFCIHLEGSSFAILYGMNRLKFMTFTDLGVGILCIIISYIVLKYSGMGVWIVIVPTIILETLARPVYLYYTAQQIDYPRISVFTKIYFPAIKVLLPTFIAALLCYSYLPFNGFFKLIAECAITGAIYIIILWYLGFNPSDKKDVLSILLKRNK